MINYLILRHEIILIFSLSENIHQDCRLLPHLIQCILYRFWRHMRSNLGILEVKLLLHELNQSQIIQISYRPFNYLWTEIERSSLQMAVLLFLLTIFLNDLFKVYFFFVVSKHYPDQGHHDIFWIIAAYNIYEDYSLRKVSLFLCKGRGALWPHDNPDRAYLGVQKFCDARLDVPSCRWTWEQ